MINVRITKSIPTDKIMKQIKFGTARGLTTTAGQAQKAVIAALKETFIIRKPWYQPGTPVGIKREIATPQKLTATVHTSAQFLERHEQGLDKIPYKNYLAIPIIPFAKPSKQALIPSKNLPKNLKNAFILTTRTGKKILCIRNPGTGRRRRGVLSSLPRSGGRETSGLVTMYTLVSKAKIKKESTFFDPIQKVVDEKLEKNIQSGIQNALANVK